jgi:hypothetical protein
MDREFPYWGTVVHEELYDLSSDPAEKNNLVLTRADKLAHLRRILADYAASISKDSRKHTYKPSEEEIEALRALGYVH